MNSLQQELNNINQQLEHLNARKAQLEPIIAEYTDVINRVKNLTENMIALNIEPTNLRFDLEDILEGNEAGDWVREADIFASEPDATPEPTPEPQPGQDFVKDWMDATTEAHSEQPEDYDTFYPELTPEPTPQPVKMFAFVPGFPVPTPESDSNHEKINSYIIPFDPVLHGEPELAQDIIKDKLKQLHDDGVKAILKGELLAHHFNSLTANELEQHLEKLAEQGLINLGDSSIMLKFPEPEEPPSIYQLTNTVGWQHFSPRVYFKDDTLKLFIPRKSRYRKELEAISQTCSTILMIKKQEVHEVGDDWIVVLNPVYDVAVQAVIDEFYPSRKDWTETSKPTPEPDSEECPKCEGEGVIESAIEEDQICVDCGGTGEKPEPEPEPAQINMQAYRRNDTLLIGFTNKRLLNTWAKWFKSTWSDQVHVSDHSDNLQGFNYCLTVLWFGNPHWERLTKLNYSLKPTEQNRTLGQVASSEEE